MVVCKGCQHRRQFHKKVDGNAWCAVPTCACKQFEEAEINFNRRELHDAIDKIIDDALKPPEK